MEKNTRGLAFLELVIAIIIIAGTMIPLASVMGYGGRATMKDNRQIVAIQLMEKVASQLLQAPYKAIPQGIDLVAYPDTSVQLGPIQGPNGVTYTVSLTCSEINPVVFSYYSVDVHVPGFLEANPPIHAFNGPKTLQLTNCIKRLEIKVSWQESEGHRSEINCLTFRADLNRKGLD